MNTLLDPAFLSIVRGSIESLRRYGLHDVQIGVIVQDIGANAISFEYRRIQELIRTNPPRCPTHGEIADALPKPR